MNTDVELKYDPVKKKTVLSINGEEIKDWDCFGTGEDVRLRKYVSEFFPELVKYMELGPGAECSVQFYGTPSDYEDVVDAHKEWAERTKGEHGKIHLLESVPYKDEELLKKIMELETENDSQRAQNEKLKGEVTEAKEQIERVIIDEEKKREEAHQQALEAKRLEREEFVKFFSRFNQEIIVEVRKLFEENFYKKSSVGNIAPGIIATSGIVGGGLSSIIATSRIVGGGLPGIIGGGLLAIGASVVADAKNKKDLQEANEKYKKDLIDAELMVNIFEEELSQMAKDDSVSLLVLGAVICQLTHRITNDGTLRAMFKSNDSQKFAHNLIVDIVKNDSSLNQEEEK